MKTLFKLLFLTLPGFACTANEQSFSDVIKVGKVAEGMPLVATTAKAHNLEFPFRGENLKVEYLSCELKGATRTWVLMNRDHAPFGQREFCQGWIAQAFIHRGFHVVGLNRPGYGGSGGQRDLGGLASAKAVAELRNRIPKELPLLAKVAGHWGYGSATSALLSAAKIHQIDTPLLLGGGFYDLEKIAKESSSEPLKKEIQELQKREGPRAYEERSISWDFQGIPKKLFLYHGKLDTFAPLGQAQSFQNSLLAQQYQVKFTIIDQATHDIDWQTHRALLQTLVGL